MVNHPNVLKVHGAAENIGYVGLWSDLVEGETLAEWTKAGRRLGSGELITIGIELSTALAAIHGAGLIHGDIKPDNVLRTSEGRFVLVDFGASVPIGKADKIRGTPLYAAPEVLNGAAPTVASDLYGLGALLFRLASGHPPVQAQTFAELVQIQRERRRTLLLDARPDLPRNLVAAIEHALNQDMAARPQTAGEYATELADCIVSRKRRPAVPFVVMGIFILVSAAGMWSALADRDLPTARDVRFVRTGGAYEATLSDGATIAPGETLALEITPRLDTYAYVLNEDAHGESYQLFPLDGSEINNPLPKDHKVRLPGSIAGAAQDWRITSRGGIERFYVLLSSRPIDELEKKNAFHLVSKDIPVESEELLAGGPLRGAGGIKKHETPVGTVSTKMTALIERLMANDTSVRLERLELSNP